MSDTTLRTGIVNKGEKDPDFKMLNINASLKRYGKVLKFCPQIEFDLFLSAGFVGLLKVDCRDGCDVLLFSK